MRVSRLCKLFFIGLFVSNTVWATEVFQDGKLAPQAHKDEQYEPTKLFELTTSISTKSGYIEDQINAFYGSRPFLSVAFSVGRKKRSHRIFWGGGLESMGQLISSVNGAALVDLNHFFAKVTYDQNFLGISPNLFVFGSLTFIPEQGNSFTSGGIEYSPKKGFGYEIGLGWVSPFYLAFDIGYRQQSRGFSFARGADETTKDVGYRGLFLTTSFGRF